MVRVRVWPLVLLLVACSNGDAASGASGTDGTSSTGATGATGATGDAGTTSAADSTGTGDDGIEYGEPITEPMVFESADGSVRLVAAEGTRLPVGGVTIDIIDASELDPSFEGALEGSGETFETTLAARFGPAGAEFNIPLQVQAAIETPEQPDEFHLFAPLMLDEGEPVTLENPELTVRDGELIEVRGDVPHFSDLAIREALANTTVEQLSPIDDLFVKDVGFRPLVSINSAASVSIDVRLEFLVLDCVDGDDSAAIEDTDYFDDSAARTHLGVAGSTVLHGPGVVCTEHSPDEVCGDARIWYAILRYRLSEAQQRAMEVLGTKPRKFVKALAFDPLEIEKGHVRCIGEGSVTDPEDLTGLPALDVRGAIVSQIPNGTGHWVRLQFGDDFPPQDVWSWFVRYELLDADGNVVATIYYQEHEGVPSTIIDGVIADEDVAFAPEGSGLHLELKAEFSNTETMRITTGYALEPDDEITLDTVQDIPLWAVEHLP